MADIFETMEYVVIDLDTLSDDEDDLDCLKEQKSKSLPSNCMRPILSKRSVSNDSQPSSLLGAGKSDSVKRVAFGQVDVETYKPVDYHKFSYGDLPPRPPRDFKMELAKQMLRAAAQQKSW
mmetsp:Transcript_13334/g.30412  ORF Transcript_13334/g.30412 Transcript_13334/m.30412 type:complete len:121 (+) Transcript_13334:92-454(+)